MHKRRHSGIVTAAALTALLVFLFLPKFVLAGQFDAISMSKDEPVEVTGDTVSFDRDKNTYSAAGSVVVTQGSKSIKADSAILDLSGGMVSASGNIVVTSGDGSYLKADTLSIRLEDKTAIILNARIYYKDGGVYVSADELAKSGEDVFSGRNISFTTCECPEGESPAWEFRARRARLTLGDYFTARGAAFYVKGVPALYTPFIFLPAAMERKTGFLTPSLGFSRERGIKFDNSFFWAISGNRDATFYLDAESRRGLGTGMEYRYIRSEKSFGDLYFYRFGERSIDRVHSWRSDELNYLHPADATSGRWRLKFRHAEFMGNGWSFKADADFVSDDEFFLDFQRESKERHYESIETSVSATKSFSGGSLNAEIRRFNNLYLKNDDTVLQKYPAINLTLYPSRIYSTPVFFSFAGEFVNYERGSLTEGQRTDLKPKVSLPLNFSDYFELTPSFIPRLTVYRAEESKAAGGRIDYHDRYVGQFRIDATGSYSKTFAGDSYKYDHVMRPMLSYVHTDRVGQADLPKFDSVDALAHESRIEYGFRTFLYARSGETLPRLELADFHISQSYDMRSVSERTNNGVLPDRPFSDVASELRLRPIVWANAYFRMLYDMYDNRADEFKTSLNIKPDRRNSLVFSYNFIRDVAKYAEGSVKAALTGYLGVGFNQRYSFMGDISHERGYSLYFTGACYAVDVTFSEKPSERMLMFTFTLKGVGEALSAGAGF